jgi:hypothetical protein
MSKVGIITLNGYFNYGNRLQNYALQEVIKSLGFDVQTIVVDRSTSAPGVWSRVRNWATYPIGKLYQEIYHRIFPGVSAQRRIRRMEVFKSFTEKYISETPYSISASSIPSHLTSEFDFFVAGSDQVWNPKYVDDLSVYFLEFAEEHKRISYAPSFGVSDIEPKYRELYRHLIGGINHLSVREDDGARIIRTLTGREAPVLVDPTMLLTREQWLAISEPAKNKPRGRFLLTYFLGGMSRRHKQHIKRMAQKTGLEIVNLADISDRDAFEAGPSEFIDYIDSCSLLCTDSFHGSVFSVLLEKPFIVYERLGSTSSMYSRIRTLLNKFGLESRRIEILENDYSHVFDVNFSQVSLQLEIERSNALNYLKTALSTQGTARM